MDESLSPTQLASRLLEKRRCEEAIGLYKTVLDQAREAGDDEAVRGIRSQIATAYSVKGDEHMRLHQVGDAQESYETAKEIVVQLYGPNSEQCRAIDGHLFEVFEALSG